RASIARCTTRPRATARATARPTGATSTAAAIPRARPTSTSTAAPSGGCARPEGAQAAAMRGREAVHARTHKERMLAGEPYMASDARLVAERRHARLLLREYNLSAADETERRRAILSELLGGAGHPIEIEPPFFCDYGYNITV